MKRFAHIKTKKSKKSALASSKAKSGQKLFGLCLSFILLTSCGPKRKTVEPPVENPEVFSFTGAESLPEKWWTAFDDPVLNRLVDTALAENFGLTAVWYRFQAAEAVVDRETSYLFPEVSAFARTGIDNFESDFDGSEDIELGLAASYEIDLWGRIRASMQAEKFRAEASFYDYKTAAMSLSAEIATVWFQLLTARKQLELVNRQIETNENVVELIRARFVGGQIRAVDILRQEQLLESTRNQKVLYETQLELLKNQLTVLLGKPPQNNFEFPKDSLPEPPPLPETGLPLELVRRRPDLLSSQRLLLAADRDMAEAVSNKFPRLSLDFEIYTPGASNELFKDWVYSLAANLVAPLFYGGRLQAEVNRTEAIKNQRLYEYGQVVLNAFREVEDALLREKKQKQRIDGLQRQLELAQKTSEQLKLEFLNGITDYLDVLISLDEQQQLQRELLTAKQVLLEIRISLYRALAGGFETGRETPQQQ